MEPDGASGETPRLLVLIFSKDRPYQLISSLSSLLQHVKGVVLQVSVLFKASTGAFAESYRVVQALYAHQEFHDRLEVHWEEETKDQPLGALIDRAIERGGSGAAGLMFTVDDALWFDDFDGAAAVELLRRNADVYTVHAKLSPRVEYAHPNDKFMRIPPLSSCSSSALSMDSLLEKATSELLIYERSRGEYDWNYPWELSASVYRLADVQEALDAVRCHFGREAADHPNRLEGYGVRLLKQEKLSSAKRAKSCACSARPVVAIVTINRVQALFDNPVYGGGPGGAAEASPEALDQLLRSALRAAAGLEASAADTATFLAKRLALSVDWWLSYLPAELQTGADKLSLEDWPPVPLIASAPYISAYLDSVHVPLLSAPSRSWLPVPVPAVSWLLPVKDAPKAWLQDARASIEGQRGMGLGSWELVVIDDGSQCEETCDILQEWRMHPQIQVISLSTNRGVGAALNEGWVHCRGTFVARLDADDVAHPERLRKQLSFLEEHPSIALLGGGFQTFQQSQEKHTESVKLNTRHYRLPCHPLLTRWNMLFSCSLAHPTVTMRRMDVSSALPSGQRGPYPEDEEAEDHCCWLSLPLSLQMANIADVVCFLRRHRASRSAAAAAAIQQSSYAAVRRFLAQHCGQESLTDADIAVLWGKTNASSKEQAGRTSQALDALERLFLGMLGGVGGPDDDCHISQLFREDFLEPRLSALEEYIRASCSKLRGAVAVQSLASGDVDVGAEMMKQWLKGGDAGLKSLGALINAGYAAAPAESSRGASCAD
eukprot:TRINITY_DN27429_c0_g1_i1.p1 TRINITY_DN27429_c0_g1~~TRINITY_DN27429_c0_g1_i1.p1  ORF type:complete len:775 (-),score=157.19 TRINITY_DN27429_c0_g1_i1:56-2380(-)